MVSQLNQDPRVESTAHSGHGTIAMEEDVESNAVERELIKDDKVVQPSITQVDQMT